MKKYEYKVIKTTESGFWDPQLDANRVELEMNKLGFDGWELTSVVDTNTYQGKTKEIVMFFKRESRF
jgi:hypothetical protein